MFEKILEGMFCQTWYKVATVNNSFLPLPSLAMRNILYSQVYRNTEGRNTEHILGALHMQE